MRGMLGRVGVALAAVALLSPAAAQGQSEAGRPYAGYRYYGFTRKAARGGNKLVPRSATFFGTASHEDFAGVGCQSDGTIVAFGSAYGPDFPAAPGPKILGRGEWFEVPEFVGGYPTDEDGRPARLAEAYPNRSGMVVYFAEGLGTVRRVVKFDWGVADITAGRVLEDDSLVIAGRCLPRFGSWADGAAHVGRSPAPSENARDYGPVYHEGVKMSGDVYVARLSADASRVEWVWVFEGYRGPPSQFRRGRDGALVFETRGRWRLSLDGKTCRPMGTGGGRSGRLVAVSPQTGVFVTGGDRNSGTGREPWRRPMCRGYDENGACVWQIWDWPGPLVGHDDFRLVSDSSVRRGAFDREGNLLIGGWSDGGNSVFTRSPIDLEKNVGNGGFGMSAWGAGVASFAYLIRLSPGAFSVRDWAFWASYLIFTEEDRPNSATLSRLEPLRDGSVAFYGGAASGLIQTPHNFYPNQDESRERFFYGGPYVAVFSRDFTNLRYSSYVPGVTLSDVCETARGVVFVGRAFEGDRRGNPAPVVNALQESFAGGHSDAHIILLEPER